MAGWRDGPREAVAEVVPPSSSGGSKMSVYLEVLAVCLQAAAALTSALAASVGGWLSGCLADWLTTGGSFARPSTPGAPTRRREPRREDIIEATPFITTLSIPLFDTFYSTLCDWSTMFRNNYDNDSVTLYVHPPPETQSMPIPSTNPSRPVPPKAVSSRSNMHKKPSSRAQ